jgi:N,N'-diacetylchitobiose non-reducing end deacetylase
MRIHSLDCEREKMITEVQLPNVTEAKKILAIQPHYDDNDIGAGGTLHLLAKRGTALVYLTVTDDLAGFIPQKAGITTPKADALALLQENQERAAKDIGVQEQIRLGFPDAGDYDYFLLREKIIHFIRQIKPDFIFTVDPWSPYEAHHDHVITGKACAEAAILYDLPMLGAYDPEEMEGYELLGVVFYNTAYPNLVFDISKGIETKQQALRAYTAQFSRKGMDRLIQQTTFLASYVAGTEDFQYGEALKVLAPWMLHGVPLTKML